jgi:hypothetical protein
VSRVWKANAHEVAELPPPVGNAWLAAVARAPKPERHVVQGERVRMRTAGDDGRREGAMGAAAAMTEGDRRARLAEIRESVEEGPCAACGDEDARFLLSELERMKRERLEASDSGIGLAVRLTTALTERDAARAEAANQRERVAEYQREVERRDELLAGVDADLAEARRERDEAKGALLEATDSRLALWQQRDRLVRDLDAAQARVRELKGALAGTLRVLRHIWGKNPDPMWAQVLDAAEASLAAKEEGR